MAAARWATDLASWAVPPRILEAAPESPWGFSVGHFAAFAREAIERDSPSRRRALEALPPQGTVVDVGCGAGAASLALAPPAGRVVGVDESAGMLDAFAELSAELGVEHRKVEGRWPDAAPSVEPGDVVVCHHVLYNVADLVPFAAALTDHARGRVVVEITAEHPRAWMNPLWREIHGIERPERPRAADAVEVLREAGFEVGSERWEAPFRMGGASPDEVVASIRRALCLESERDPEIRRAVDRLGLPDARTLATIWWDGTAGA